MSHQYKPTERVRWVGPETSALKRGMEFALINRTLQDGEWIGVNEYGVTGRMDENHFEPVDSSEEPQPDFIPYDLRRYGTAESKVEPEPEEPTPEGMTFDQKVRA